MLTIFSTPKAFTGHIGTIQRNAIRSWMRLEPRPEVVILGNEEGTAEVAQEVGATHVGDVATTAHGTPLLNDALERVRRLAQTPLLCLINCDVILLQEFLDNVAKVHSRLQNFLVVAQRLNVNVREVLDFTAEENKLRRDIIGAGLPGSHTAIDVFVFPLSAYRRVPPLILGRAWFDQWLIKDAREREIPVVDITKCARAIHQEHDYNHMADGQRGAYWGEEALHNLAIYGGLPHAYTLLSVTHELREDGKLRRVRLREEAFAVKHALWDVLVRRTVGVRDALWLRRKFWQTGKAS
jgi:hypothetical protein